MLALYAIFKLREANAYGRLKCNRTHPCDNCVRRGDAASCSYAAPGTRKKNQAQGGNSPDDMQNRIDRLEGLVLSLMTNGAQAAGPAAAVAAISRSTSSSGPSPGQPLEVNPHDDDMIKEEGEEGSEVEDVSSSFGALKVDNEKGKSTYFGDNHWHMVLADVRFGIGHTSGRAFLINSLTPSRLQRSRTILFNIKRSWSSNILRWRLQIHPQL